MQEDFLHFIWNYKKLHSAALQTTKGETVSVLNTGHHNHNAGPDFFNAQIRIGEQLWAGNVEIHVKASDWFLHNHEKDSTYDNVILHVVWEHDTEVFRSDQTTIPTLELQDKISFDVLEKYKKLFSNTQKWIRCDDSFPVLNDFKLKHWLEVLYVERLERKAKDVMALLQDSKNNWEGVLFTMLAKNFGLKVNGDAFMALANSIDFSILRKVQHDIVQLEALLFGQAQMLEDTIEEGYYKTLQNEYAFLKHKFKLEPSRLKPVYFRLRPSNFPTIRLAQLAQVYHKYQNVFSKLIHDDSLEAIYNVFKIPTSTFWIHHYTFSKIAKPSSKQLSKAFVQLLIINTIIPLKFAYAKYKGIHNEDALLNIASRLPSEKNAIIDKFNTLHSTAKNAMQSQALLQLKTTYCDNNKCLQCAIGAATIT